MKAFTRWFDESNKDGIENIGEGGSFYANGLVQLGDAHRSLGQARQSVLSSFSGRGGGEREVISLGVLMSLFGGVVGLTSL